jgi:hypothetical protein
MSKHRFTGHAGSLLLAALVVLPLTLLSPPAAGSTARSGQHASAQVVRDWQRIALRTVYTEAGTPIPSGTLYLGFASLAVQEAVSEAAVRRHVSPTSAAAVAAHDVLVEYFPASAPALDAALVSSLESVPAGPARRRGVMAGRAAAEALISSRARDGRNDTSVSYQRPPAPGVWQPPATGMLVAWLGFVDPLVLRRPVVLPGPVPLAGRRYARELDEVRRVGSATSTERTPAQTETAHFFNFNAVVLYRDALLRHLDTAGLSLARTADLFAALDAATADTMIQCWRAKYDYGLWRPSSAIRGADTDGNPRTAADPGWAPLLTDPPYSDYVSGHACVTSAFAEVVRTFLGDDVPLLLRSGTTGTERRYPSLSAIEHDAFLARIWSGIHFRHAMEDGYLLGHRTARRVMRELC